jgi:hypothetical protein
MVYEDPSGAKRKVDVIFDPSVNDEWLNLHVGNNPSVRLRGSKLEE